MTKRKKKICPKCGKPKDRRLKEHCECGRPSKYKPEYINKVEEYLSENTDKTVQLIKGENSESGYVSYENKLKVQLPTVEGFALFLGVVKSTLYEWAKEHKEFSNSLGKIRTEQKSRLLEKGLSGDYNSRIAELILCANHGMKKRTDITSKGEKTGNVITLTDEQFRKLIKRRAKELDR